MNIFHCFLGNFSGFNKFVNLEGAPEGAPQGGAKDKLAGLRQAVGDAKTTTDRTLPTAPGNNLRDAETGTQFGIRGTGEGAAFGKMQTLNFSPGDRALVTATEAPERLAGRENKAVLAISEEERKVPYQEGRRIAVGSGDITKAWGTAVTNYPENRVFNAGEKRALTGNAVNLRGEDGRQIAVLNRGEQIEIVDAPFKYLTVQKQDPRTGGATTESFAYVPVRVGNKTGYVEQAYLMPLQERVERLAADKLGADSVSGTKLYRELVVRKLEQKGVAGKSLGEEIYKSWDVPFRQLAEGPLKGAEFRKGVQDLYGKLFGGANIYDEANALASELVGKGVDVAAKTPVLKKGQEATTLTGFDNLLKQISNEISAFYGARMSLEQIRTAYGIGVSPDGSVTGIPSSDFWGGETSGLAFNYKDGTLHFFAEGVAGSKGLDIAVEPKDRTLNEVRIAKIQGLMAGQEEVRMAQLRAYEPGNEAIAAATSLAGIDAARMTDDRSPTRVAIEDAAAAEAATEAAVRAQGAVASDALAAGPLPNIDQLAQKPAQPAMPEPVAYKIEGGPDRTDVAAADRLREEAIAASRVAKAEELAGTGRIPTPEELQAQAAEPIRSTAENRDRVGEWIDKSGPGRLVDEPLGPRDSSAAIAAMASDIESDEAGVAAPILAPTHAMSGEPVLGQNPRAIAAAEALGRAAVEGMAMEGKRGEIMWENKMHAVKFGESPWGIIEARYGSANMNMVRELLAANKMNEKSVIRPGMELILPPTLGDKPRKDKEVPPAPEMKAE